MLKKISHILLACAAIGFFPMSGFAQSARSLADVAQVEILPGWRLETGRHLAAIHIRLAPGWKTYWRAPGDAGIPPRFAWTGSRNLKSIRFLWPTPQVFYQNESRSIGYVTDVVIPIELTASDLGNENIVLRGEMELGVCKDICIPVTATIRADLSNTGKPDPAILASISRRPTTAKEAGVGKVTCDVEPISDGLRLTASIDLPKMGNKEVAVFELPDQTIWIAPATSSRQGRQLVAVTDLVPPGAMPFLLNRSEIRITVLGDRGAVDIQGCTAS